MAVEIYTDGGARGNPGPAGAGIVIRDDQGRGILEAGYYLGRMTNNVAEYTALLMALEAAVRFGADDVTVHSDSELMVRQLTGQYQVRDAKLAELFEKVQRLLLKFDTWRILHVRREQNKRADALVNKALDAQADVVEVQLGDARPDERPRPQGARPAPAAPRRATPARQPAPPTRPSQPTAGAGPVVVARVIRRGAPHACCGQLQDGQEFAFGDTVPAGLCIYAAKALLDTVLAMRHAASEGDTTEPVRVRCARAGCGAEFEVRTAPPTGR